MKDINLRETLHRSRLTCSVDAAAKFVGDRWSLLLLREVFFGVSRYDDFLRFTGCSTAVLADRLKKLVEAGILRKEIYKAEGDRPRSEYRPTAKGVDLLPVIVGLLQWGDRYEASAKGAPLILRHRKTGERIQAGLITESGHAVMPRDSVPTLNPAVFAKRK